MLNLHVSETAGMLILSLLQFLTCFAWALDGHELNGAETSQQTLKHRYILSVVPFDNNAYDHCSIGKGIL